MITAMEKAEIDSPRGKFTLSKAHNPVQDAVELSDPERPERA
jgi:hypothetical protein